MSEPWIQSVPSDLSARVVFSGRFEGPPGFANGGFAAGTLAAALGAPAEVTLARPVPVGRPLRLERQGSRVALCDGEVVVATGEPSEPRIDVPAPISFAAAEAAAARFPEDVPHPFPRCFACGPLRDPGDALRLLPGPTAGGDAVAAPWVPDPEMCRDVAGEDVEWVPAPLTWAALDCPGAWSVFVSREGPRSMVLLRIAAQVVRPPRVGQRHVVLGWRIGHERRKHYCGTALFDDAGRLCAFAKSTWIALA
jgi:hypothetical protein